MTGTLPGRAFTRCSAVASYIILKLSDRLLKNSAWRPRRRAKKKKKRIELQFLCKKSYKVPTFIACIFLYINKLGDNRTWMPQYIGLTTPATILASVSNSFKQTVSKQFQTAMLQTIECFFFFFLLLQRGWPVFVFCTRFIFDARKMSHDVSLLSRSVRSPMAGPDAYHDELIPRQPRRAHAKRAHRLRRRGRLAVRARRKIETRATYNNNTEQ